MRVNKIHSLDEIRDLYKDANPKFICLKDSAGNFVVHYNQPKLQDEKFKDVIVRIKKTSTTPGQYYVCFKNSTMPTATETQYPINVGNFSLQEAPQQQQMVGSGESVWNMQTALQMSVKLASLELEMNYVRAENVKLQQLVDELEKELEELEEKQAVTLAETPPENPLQWIKDLKTTFGPLAEMYFKQEDRKLQLKEHAAGYVQTEPRRNKIEHRRDGGVVPDGSNEYKEYFENILNSGDEAALNYECDWLQSYDSELYEKTMQFYKITEEVDEDEETDESENSVAS